MVSIGTSVKRQSTNFYSFLPIGYWLERENWVHFIHLTVHVVIILGGKYLLDLYVKKICFNFVFASCIFFFLMECNSQFLYQLFQVRKHC